MIGVLIRGVIRLVTKPQADKLVSRGIAQKIPTRGQDAAQVAGKKVGTKEFNKLVRTRPPKVVKPKVVTPKSKTPKYKTSAKNIKTTGGGARPPAGNVKVTTGGGTSKLPVVAGSRAVSKRGADLAKRMAAAGITKKGGSYFKAGKKATKKQLIKAGIVPATAVGIGISTLGKKDVVKKPPQAATTNGKKPPKPSKPVTTAPAPPSQLPSSPNGKKPKPQQSGPSGGPPQRAPIKAKPKTFEERLKAQFVKDRGGEKAFGKGGSDSAWTTHLFDMREGHEAGLTFTDQQNYDKVMAERKELSKKKRGGVIKRKRGGVVRGVGKALRGYGKASYSNKMY
jgi:hypothetical protein